MGPEEVAEAQPLSYLPGAGGWQGLGNTGQFIFTWSDSFRCELESQVGHLRAAKDALVQVHFDPVSCQSSQHLVQKVQVFRVLG